MMTLSASDYLSNKGAIELLCEISPEGTRFEELVSEVPVSRPTLSKRLAEGREVSLLKRQPITGEQGTTHEHTLTPRGATVRVRLFEQGLVLEYQQYKQALKQFKTSTEEFQQAIKTNPPNLGNEEANMQNLQTILQRNALSDMVEE